MSTPAIRVLELGKQYRIGRREDAYPTLRETLGGTLRAPFRRWRELRGNGVVTFWALRDVNFEVQTGEVVGIIGRNGAGKSTLLKILSRITEPTTGRAELRGRVASLIEVGTGFHPELSGRENVYLNGAILGMRKAEIARNFDAIVAFAEIDQFLDTPVKRYSSGMYVRLAFAVAAHLEPEILIVDEVLAVGDFEFQKKCLGKMQEVARGNGRTVLFVSHNMIAVRNLCSRALLLRDGRLVTDSDVSRTIETYTSSGRGLHTPVWQRDPGRHWSNLVIERLEVQVRGAQPAQRLHVRALLRSLGEHKPAFVTIDILDATRTGVMQAIPRSAPFISSEQAEHPLDIEIELPPLVPGHYVLTVWAGPSYIETFDIVEEAVGFQVADSPVPGRTAPHTPEHGYIVPASRLAAPA